MSRAEPEPAAPTGDHVRRRGYSLRLMHLAHADLHPASAATVQALRACQPGLWPPGGGALTSVLPFQYGRWNGGVPASQDWLGFGVISFPESAAPNGKGSSAGRVTGWCSGRAAVRAPARWGFPSRSP